MTYIVNDKCIKCNLTDCVDVCPVDDDEGENMLVINPMNVRIVGCEPECPIDAIEPDTNPNTEKFVLLNKNYLRSGLTLVKRKNQ